MMDPLNQDLPDDGSLELSDDAAISVEEKPTSELLRYKSKLHGKVLARLMSLRDSAETPIKNMHDKWNRVDEHAGMYVDITRSAIKGDGTIKTGEKEIPFERSFVVPVYFAVERVILTQLTSIFQARDPAFQYDGHGPEDVNGAKLMEARVGYDLRMGRINLQLYQAFQNALRYGISPVHTYLYEDFGWTMKPLISGPAAAIVGPMYPDLMRPVRQWGLRKSYVRHMPVDPYKMRVDPRKSIVEFQDGDMIGHQRVESLIYFKQRTLDKGDGPYFNVDKLEEIGYETHSNNSYRNDNVSASVGNDPDSKEDTRSYEVEHLEVRLIPREWGLGDSDRAEIWWFEWCSDDIIVRAHPSAYDHGMFSYSVGASFPDNNIMLSPGLGELIEPLQRFVNWMGSSHLENIRRFVNNAALIGEEFVEIEDVLNPSPAGHIRLTQAAQDLISQGLVSNPAVFYQQLGLQDVTGGHLNEISQMFDWVARMTGANDPAQGIHLPSKRTATEIEKLSAASSQRTSSMAELLDSTLVQSMAEQHAMIVQEFTTDEQWYRVDGDLARTLMQQVGPQDVMQSDSDNSIRVRIAPSDLYGMYDYVAYTGMDPNSPARSVEALMQLLQVGGGLPVVSDPMVSMQMGETEILDVKEVFIRAFENMKVKDVRRLFKTNPLIEQMQQQQQIGVVPDEQLQAGIQAGNYVPAGQV